MFGKRLSRWMATFVTPSDRGVLYKLTEENRLYFNNGSSLWWNAPGNFEMYTNDSSSQDGEWTSESTIVSAGRVKDGHNMKQPPQGGWAQEVACLKGHGYWIKMVYKDGSSQMVRLWVKEELVEGEGKVVGVLIRFEKWTDKSI